MRSCDVVRSFWITSFISIAFISMTYFSRSFLFGISFCFIFSYVFVRSSSCFLFFSAVFMLW